MKRNYLLLICLFLCGLLSAENISIKQAEDFALAFFQQHARSRSITHEQLQMVWDGEETQSRNNAAPAFYVFNRTDQPGFVIVSGDNIAMPVLGYSLDNGFRTENIPNNIRYWLLGIREEINKARKDEFQPASRTIQAWDSRAADIGQVILERESAKWDQTELYKELCPIIDGRKAVTGCTATAMAIVLKSREWPDKGVGTIPAYSYSWNGNTYEIPGQELGHTYDWDQMPKQLTPHSTPEQIKQVATLMRDCGLMSKAEYTSGDTGADCSISFKSLIQYMKYSSNAFHGFDDMFSREEWHSLIRKELQENGPVFYTCNWYDGGGHAFVLDGYTSADFYRVNWGWSGYCDGYYLLSALNYDAQGSASDMNNYSRLQTAFFGLTKAIEGETITPKLLLSSGSYNNFYFNGVIPNTNDIQPNVPFTTSVGFINNIGAQPFYGIFEIGLFGKDDQFKEKINQWDIILTDLHSNYKWRHMGIDCKITQSIEEGDYIALRYRTNDGTEWHIMTGGEGVSHKYIINDESLKEEFTGTLYIASNGGYDSGIQAQCDDEYKKGEAFFAAIQSIFNESSQAFTGEITLTHIDKTGNIKGEIIENPLKINQLGQNQYLKFDMITCIIQQDIEEGDSVIARYKHQNDQEWKRLKAKDHLIDAFSLKDAAPIDKDFYYLSPVSFNGYNYNGITTEETEFVQDKEFIVHVGGIYTDPSKRLYAYNQVWLFDVYGKRKEKIDLYYYTFNGGYLDGMSIDFPCKITSMIEPGDYIAFVYKTFDGSRWIEAPTKGGAIGRIVVKPEETLISGSTQFTYNRISKLITIKTLKGVSYQLTDADGNTIQNATLTDSDTFTIATADMQAGTYYLTIGNEESQMKTSFVIGNNKNNQ